MKIDKVYAEVLSIQDYGNHPPITGVRFVDLAYHRDDGGDFAELCRLRGGHLETIPDFNIQQISTSRLLPGTVKAFHLHQNQTDLWFVHPLERLLVGLLDTRDSSATLHQTMRFILGAGLTQLLLIPPGVAHGAANLWAVPANLTYFTDQQFTPKDEGRLPYDLFGEEFWTVKKG